MYYMLNRGRVVFSIGEMEVTVRELLVSLMIIALFTVSSFFIRGCISNKNADALHEVSVTTEVQTPYAFKWAKETCNGRFVGADTLVAVTPAVIDGVKGMVVRRALEEYTRHTVVHTSCNKNGCHSYTTHYWSWDEQRSDYAYSDNVEFFNIRDIEFVQVAPSPNYVKTKDIGYHLRYVYYRTPLRVPGVLNGTIHDRKFSELTFYENCVTINDWREKRLNKFNRIDTAFVIVWTIICVVVLIFFWREYWPGLEE